MIKLSAAALAHARLPGHSALLFTDVKPPTGQSAGYMQAAAQDLSQMGLTVLDHHIFFGQVTGRRSERTTMAVVARTNDGADRWLRSIVSGRPLDGSAMQPADNIGAITLRDGSNKAKVQLLPFDGDEYGVFAFVDTVLLLNEPQCSERLSLTQRLMVNPMIQAAATELIDATDEAITQYETATSSDMLEAIQRSAASKKLVHQRSIREALVRVSQTPEQYILVTARPIQSFPCLDALDATAQLITRDDADREASRRRASLGWAFARESSIATVVVRKSCRSPADARAAMLVAQRLLRTPTPSAASVLRPTGSVSDVTLVKPSKLAEARITMAAVKAKLHILACDQPWAYDAVASANAGNTDQATYAVPHTLAANVAETWADAFRAASDAAGTPVDLVVEPDHFSVTTLPTYTGPDVYVYSIEDIIVDVNLECGTNVSAHDVDMEFSRAEVVDATPTNLRRAVEAGGYLPAIVRWSRSQPPGNDPLPWHAEVVPAATPVPAGVGGAVAFATTAQPAPRFEGLTQTIARVTAIESAFMEMARAQTQTANSVAQLTSSVAALVQHAGIANALPAPPPVAQPQTYAAIAAAPAHASGATVTTQSGDVMDTTAAAPAAAAPAPGTAWHGQLTPAAADGSGHTGAAPSAEMDLNDDSIPELGDAPVARRTRLSLALAFMRPSAAVTAPGTSAEPAAGLPDADHELPANDDEWDDLIHAATDDEWHDSGYMSFDDDGGDEHDGDDDDDDDSTAQRADESSDEYEARLSSLVPPTQYFCCRPVFS